MFQQILGGGAFYDAAFLEDNDVIGYCGNGIQIVRDKEHGHARFALQVAQEGQNFMGNCVVQGGGWFVGNEELGLLNHGHGDHDALSLPTAELMRVLAEGGFDLWDVDALHPG
jgi:hypothetical protein